MIARGMAGLGVLLFGLGAWDIGVSHWRRQQVEESTTEVRQRLERRRAGGRPLAVVVDVAGASVVGERGVADRSAKDPIATDRIVENSESIQSLPPTVDRESPSARIARTFRSADKADKAGNADSEPEIDNSDRSQQRHEELFYPVPAYPPPQPRVTGIVCLRERAVHLEFGEDSTWAEEGEQWQQWEIVHIGSRRVLLRDRECGTEARLMLCPPLRGEGTP